MASITFTVGETFSSFSEFDTKIQVYLKANCVQFWRRDSRTIEKAAIRMTNRNFKNELKYAHLTYSCIHGGRNYKGRGEGQRNNRVFCRQNHQKRYRENLSGAIGKNQSSGEEGNGNEKTDNEENSDTESEPPAKKSKGNNSEEDGGSGMSSPSMTPKEVLSETERQYNSLPEQRSRRQNGDGPDSGGEDLEDFITNNSANDFNLSEIGQNVIRKNDKGNKRKSGTPVYSRHVHPKNPRVCSPNAMTEKQILELSRQIGKEWEQLRIQLDYTEAQGHALRSAFNENVQLMIHVMLKSWYDVVVDCGENPNMLLAAAFIKASSNVLLARNLVAEESFDANASAKQSTVDRIQQITFCKSGKYDGYCQSGRHSSLNYGGQGAVNVFGGDVRFEGTVAIHGSSSNPSLVSSDGQGGAGSLGAPQSGSFNVYDGKVVMGSGANVVIGPPGNPSLVSSDGQGGGGSLGVPQSGSFNVYDGKVVMGPGANVIIGPPGSSYLSPSTTPAVKWEKAGCDKLRPVNIRKRRSSIA